MSMNFIIANGRWKRIIKKKEKEKETLMWYTDVRCMFTASYPCSCEHGNVLSYIQSQAEIYYNGFQYVDSGSPARNDGYFWVQVWNCSPLVRLSSGDNFCTHSGMNCGNPVLSAANAWILVQRGIRCSWNLKIITGDTNHSILSEHV